MTASHLQGAVFCLWGKSAMNITVNGRNESISSDSIMAYIREKGMNPKALVVELNGQVVVADRWDQTPLCEGDRLELLSFVGGG
jgi:sulfur carrier protein